MKNQFKRVLALLLAVVMILGVMPSVFAANVGPFKDVQDNAWYAPYVKAVYENGLMQGVSTTKFNPEGTSTRAQVATVLYRIAGQPPVGGPATFTDLTADWYANPVAWAQEKGIVNGLSATKFGPNENVTREQLVVMIHRYFGTPAGTGDLSAFPDADKVSGYAKNAFAWAIGAGIINGSNGKLNPQGQATRAQFAKIIWLSIPEPCEHVWDEGVVTKEPTCVASGIKTFTCTICGETEKEPIAATGEHTYKEEITLAPTCGSYGIKTLTCTACGSKVEESIDPTGEHTYVDGICTGCGDKPGKVYTLTSGLKDGDEVIIYNAGSGKAMSATMNGFYLAGVDMTPADNKLETGDSSIIWTVKANDDGTYTFLNGTNELGADVTTNDNGTFTNIYVENGHKAKWALDTCNAANGSFYISNTELQAKYEKIYLEWYEKKGGFSAYDTSADRLNEAVFGFQFFALDPSGVINPTVPTDPTDPTDPPVPGEDYVLTDTLKDGDQVVIVAAAKNMALSATYNGYYNAAVAVAPVDGILNGPAADLVWTVGKDGDTYTFSYNGQKIGMNAEKSSMPLGGIHDTWQILPSKTENAYYVFNIGREVYMEYYEKNGNWSGYYNNSDEALFALNFYVLDGEKPTESTTESTSESTTESTAPVDGETYELKNEIKDGDKIIIVYAAENKALSSEILGTYYKAGVDVLPEDGKIVTSDATIVWTVAADGEGFNLINAAGEKLSIDGTFNSIPYDKDNDAWTLAAAETADHVYVVNQNGKHLSWSSYGNFSAYDATNQYTSEAFRAMQVYVLSDGGNDDQPCVHAWDEGKVTKEPTCTEIGVREFTCTLCEATKTESIPATGVHTYENGVCTGCGKEDDSARPQEVYTRVNELKEGAEIIIVCDAKGVALSATYGTNYNNGVEVEVVDGKITTSDKTLVWTVGKEGEFYTFSYEGQKIGMGTEYSSMPLGAVNYKWTVTPGVNEGTFYVGNPDRDPSKGVYYMEWYESKGYWSAYHKLDDALMALAFYAKDVEGEEPTEPTTAPTEPTTEPATAPTEPTTAPTEPTTEPTTAPTEPGELTEGKYVVAAKVGETYYAMANVFGGKIKGEVIEVVDGKVASADAYVVELAKSGDNWTIKGAEGFLSYVSSTNLGTSEEGYAWVISEGTNGTWRIGTEDAKRAVLFRAAASNGTEYYQFGAYAQSNGKEGSTEYFDVELIPVDGAVVEPTEATEPTTEATEPTTEATEPTTEATEPTTETEPVVDGTYGLVSALKDGDKVIIYNAGNGMAVSNVMAGYYVAGVAVAPAEGKIATTDATVVWTVKANADGTYSFVNGETVLSADASGNYNNLFVEAGHKSNWELSTCNAENLSFYVTNPEMTAKYGKIYLEWYAAKSAFSAYDAGESKLTEKDFGFQFYVLDAEPETVEPTEPTTEATEPTTEPTEEPTECTTPEEIEGAVAVSFADLQDGDVIAIVITANPEMTGKDYVLLNNFGSDAYSNAAVFEGTFTETMYWTVKIVDGKVYLVNGEVGLSIIDNNNGLRADGEAMVIEMDESGYLKMTDPSGNVRYIGVYDNNLGDVSKVANPNIRTYKNYTNNTKNQTTTIYKIG